MVNGVDLIFYLLAASAAPAESNESIDIDAFEQKFGQLYSDPADQEQAKETLEAEEAEVKAQNQLFNEGMLSSHHVAL